MALKLLRPLAYHDGGEWSHELRSLACGVDLLWSASVSYTAVYNMYIWEYIYIHVNMFRSNVYRFSDYKEAIIGNKNEEYNQQLEKPSYIAFLPMAVLISQEAAPHLHRIVMLPVLVMRGMRKCIYSEMETHAFCD